MSDLLNQASLVMIPSGYKEDVVYSQIPTNGNGDLSFTRASNGTRINSAGLVEDVPWNIWTGSNDFSSTYWNQYQLTPTTGTTSDIYGNSSTVYKLIGSVTNSYSFINRSSNGSQNTAFSFYAKPNGYTKIGISNRSGNPWNFVVDLVTKVVSNISDSSSRIVSINVIDAIGDWKRIEVVVSTAIQYNLHPLPSNFNSTNFDNVTLNGTDGVWVMGAQLNIGSTAKPYFPTTDRLNVPRLTYQNGGGGCPSLLLEKQSTNLVTYSEQFDNAAYATDGTGSVTANNTTSPDGTQNADLFTSSVNGLSYIYENFAVTNGVTYTTTVFAKAGTTNFLLLDTINNARGVIFNLLNGTIASTINGTGTITSVGNGWYRCSVTSTATSTGGIFLFMPPTSGSSANSAIGNSVYVWGAQTEVSSYPTSYIPTTSSSATRVADACSKTGISSLFGTNQGTFFIDFVYYGSEQFCYIFDVTDASNVNRFLMYDSNGSGLFYFYDNGYAVIDAYQLTKGQRYKIAVKYNSSGTIWYVNGVLQGTGAVSFAHQMSQLYLGIRYSITDNTGMTVNESIVFPTALSTTELASLTTI